MIQTPTRSPRKSSPRPLKNSSATAEKDWRTYFHHIRVQNPRKSRLAMRGPTVARFIPDTSAP